MTKLPKFVALLMFAALLATVSAQGAKVYKWVDEDGRVTYRDRPPPAESGGEVQEKNLDTNSNVIQYEAPPEPPTDDSKQKGTDGGPPPEESGSEKSDMKKSALDYKAYDDERRRLEMQRQQQRRTAGQ